MACAADAQVNWTYDVAQEPSIQGYRIYYGTTTQAGATTNNNWTAQLSAAVSTVYVHALAVDQN